MTDDETWDLIYELGEMLGGPYLVGANDGSEDFDLLTPCSPERSRLIQDVLAIARNRKATRSS